jgi:hypothetical protein
MMLNEAKGWIQFKVEGAKPSERKWGAGCHMTTWSRISASSQGFIKKSIKFYNNPSSNIYQNSKGFCWSP